MNDWNNMQWFSAGFGTMLAVAVIAIKVIFRSKRKK